MGQDAGRLQATQMKFGRDRLLAVAAAARPTRPNNPRPIVVVGAGGIVRTAHLPAYKKAGFPVVGIMDCEPGKAAALAADMGISRSYETLPELIRYAPPDTVFDVAVPAAHLPAILIQLPKEAAVLMQKPMGENLSEARIIRDICREKRFAAAVNFSFRCSPNNLVAQSIADAGFLGEIHDLEVQVRTYTPWHLWPFLAKAPRLEILYHSIHYLDLVRSWLGEPHGVYAVTVKNPVLPDLAPTKSSILLDYGDRKRVFIVTNHGHDFGAAHQESFVQWEGTLGAARMTLGINLDYPHGKADSLEYCEREASNAEWISLPLTGNTFPDAFMGTMGTLQAYVEGSSAVLPSNIEDAFKTMALVEACYLSSERPGEPILAE